MAVIRTKAPLRLGLAGGGTDVSPYCDTYGGCVLNVTIDLFAYCTLTSTNNGQIKFYALDRDECFQSPVSSYLEIDGNLDLHKGVYNRIIRDYGIDPFSFELQTFSDAPAGSGLGSSSTLVVTILKAFIEYLNLPLREYEIAQLAFSIEREDLMQSGGRQDQYAATFGGFNFIEFYGNNRVVVNPLRIKQECIDELEASMLLFFTGTSRLSSKIIDDQKNSLKSSNPKRLEAMHRIKEDAYQIKEYLLKGDFNNLYAVMADSWKAKKNTSDSISNDYLDTIYDAALGSGAYSGKISGAGGGGFMMFFIDPMRKLEVKRALKIFDGQFVNFHFFDGGACSWRLDLTKQLSH